MQADCATTWPLSLRSSSVLQTTPSHRLPFLQLLLPDPRDSAPLQAATCYNAFSRLSTAPWLWLEGVGLLAAQALPGLDGRPEGGGSLGAAGPSFAAAPGAWARDSFPLPRPGAASRPWGLFLALSPVSSSPETHRPVDGSLNVRVGRPFHRASCTCSFNR